MRAITLIPGQDGSARLDDVPEPSPEDGAVLVDGLALGICGTDLEIIRGEYGFAPDGAERLVLGHESLGRVRECPDDSGLSPGDLVVGIVRRPDPEPCACCARGEWDFCRNGRYTERGIKELHGFGSERWRIEPEFAVRIDAGLADVGVLAGADERRRQGVGADRADRRPGVLRRPPRARHRRGADRPARGAAGRAARL